jgi:DNA repair protein RadC
VAHNHPSGRTEPSSEDDDITQTLCEAGIVLGISVVDHLVFTEEGYYSYHQAGKV